MPIWKIPKHVSDAPIAQYFVPMGLLPCIRREWNNLSFENQEPEKNKTNYKLLVLSWFMALDSNVKY